MVRAVVLRTTNSRYYEFSLFATRLARLEIAGRRKCPIEILGNFEYLSLLHPPGKKPFQLVARLAVVVW